MFAEAAKLTLSQCATEVGTVRKMTSLIKREVERRRSAANELKGKDQLIKKLKPSEEDIPDKLIKVRKEEHDMLDAQGNRKGIREDPNKVGPDEFFKHWNSFCKSNEKACVENDKLKETKKKEEEKASKARPSMLPASREQIFCAAKCKCGKRRAAHISAKPPAAMMGQLAGVLAKRGVKK